MKKVFYIFCFLITGLMSTIPLSAQSITITEADGLTVSGCDSTPGVTVDSSNLTINILADIVLPSGVTITQINIFHQYGTFGNLTTTNFTGNIDPTSDGMTLNYNFVLDNTVFDGDGSPVNLIQVRLITDDPNNGNVGCSIFISVNAPLPVELTSFDGKETGKTNTLTWQTASELNNSHFEVERSLDGNNFRQIGNVHGNGTSVYKIDYQFEDHNPVAQSYYRLKQVDYDEKFEYSDIIVINSRNHKPDITSIFPNPTSDILNVSYSSETIEELTFKVVDLTGRVLFSKINLMENGNNVLELDCKTLPKGSYFLILQSDSVNQSKLFLKQ